MTVTADLPQTEPRSVHANGIDIHYLEAGDGRAARPPPRGRGFDQPDLDRGAHLLRLAHGDAVGAFSGHRARHPRRRAGRCTPAAP